MKREYSVSGLVYNYLFPNPTANDPTDFPQHLQRNLVSEVRIETQRFYGGLETVEARYPGLNYSFGPHRKRLGRFPHHNRLFKAFDALGLTEHEIATLCRWEGTLWARLRYERDEGIKVIDTTGNEILPCAERRHLKRKAGSTGRIQGITRVPSAEGIKVKTDIEVEIEEVRNSSSTSLASTAAPSLSRMGLQQSESRMPTPRPVQMFRRPESLDAIMQDAAVPHHRHAELLPHHQAQQLLPLPAHLQGQARHPLPPPQQPMPTYTTFSAPELLLPAQQQPAMLTPMTANAAFEAFGNKEDADPSLLSAQAAEQDSARASMSPSPAPVAVTAATNIVASLREGHGQSEPSAPIVSTRA